VRLNASTFLAIGHTMTDPCGQQPASALEACQLATKWRAYAHFGYTFDAAAPFTVRAATSEFRIRRTHGATVLERPLPAASAVKASAVSSKLKHSEPGSVQFPVGLVLDAPSERLLLSWGYNGIATEMTSLSLPHLLQQMSLLA
jgi:hypothetical protein